MDAVYVLLLTSISDGYYTTMLQVLVTNVLSVITNITARRPVRHPPVHQITRELEDVFVSYMF